ncbi:hypothetical protein [Lysobacter capsici]|uniref:hypothetical protein n=1 Tax=Lysobacter capsici TaxID=435897 RepID=UPI001C0018D1|nr:hypothetical protein [Lysobacter capsici]QWF15305.1 hypothetical protein KME82_16075 [Lysobacter capsici]
MSYRSIRLTALAIGLFGFAASLAATAGEEDCARCRLLFQICMTSNPGDLACYEQHGECLRQAEFPFCVPPG